MSHMIHASGTGVISSTEFSHMWSGKKSPPPFKCLCNVWMAPQCTNGPWWNVCIVSFFIDSWANLSEHYCHVEAAKLIMAHRKIWNLLGVSLCSISHRQNPVFITGIPANENRFFPVWKLHREIPVLALYWPCKGLQCTCSSNKLWAYQYYIFLIRRES